MTERQRWADVAKGGCIVLVVLWHVTRKDFLLLPWDADLDATAAWGQLAELLLPVRMPLFFLVSGLVAVRLLARPWGEVLVRRVAPLFYFYALWTLVHTVVLQLAPDFPTAIADSVPDVLEQLTFDPGNLWYLSALALYVAVARATRRAPYLALASALVLSALASADRLTVLDLHDNQPSMLANLVWFLLGTRLPGLPWTTRWMARPAPLTVIAVIVYAVGAAIWQAEDAEHVLGVRPALGLVGIIAGAGLATVVSTVPRLGLALAAIGRRTLPVYVIHLPLVALVSLASTHVVTEGSDVAGSAWLAFAYPGVVTVAVLVATLSLHRLLERAGAWWLFAAPWRR